MEATQKNVYSRYDNLAKSSRHSNGLAETSTSVRPTRLRSEVHRCVYPEETYPQIKRSANPRDEQCRDSIKHPGSGCKPRVQAPSTPVGVSNCYVFKSQLQEYAQKVGISTPTYETIREGPSHEPSFMSTVVVSGVRYDSLPGFFSRKAAEQSAAEIALKELSTYGQGKESISVPVHETGLCKNVLQEYAQKMNYAIPTYIFQNDHAHGRKSFYTCTVEMGGIQYIGASASTKKEAEIKAARTALLAIQSSGVELGNGTDYAVVPCKRKVPETPPSKRESTEPRKRKNPRLKNKRHKKTKGPPTVKVDVAHVSSKVGADVDPPQLTVGQQEASDQDGGNDILVVNTEASKPVDAVNLESRIEPGRTGHDPAGPNALNPGIGSVEETPAGNANSLREAPKQVDAVNLESMTEPGEAGHCPTGPSALIPGIGSVEETPAGNANFLGEASKQVDAVNLDSMTEPGEAGHGLTGPNVLIPGIGSVEETPAGNANPLGEASKEVDGVNSDSSIEPAEADHDQIGPNALIPGIGLVEETPAGNANSLGEASKQVDAVNLDSRIESGKAGHDPTGPNTLIPGIGSVEASK